VLTGEQPIEIVTEFEPRCVLLIVKSALLWFQPKFSLKIWDECFHTSEYPPVVVRAAGAVERPALGFPRS
jgi:hypothetical protein